MDFFKTDNMKTIIKNIIDVLEAENKIRSIAPKDIEDKYLEGEFPLTKSTWDKYKKFLSPKAKKAPDIQSIKIDNLYNVCVYANVSADYILGFNDTAVKEASARQIKEDFGLSDNALKCLASMREHKDIILPVKYKQYAEIQYIDFLITNFARRFLSVISDYFCELEKYEDLKNEINNKEYLDDFSMDQLNEIDEILDVKKYRVSQAVERFLEDFKKKLIVEDSEITKIRNDNCNNENINTNTEKQ